MSSGRLHEVTGDRYPSEMIMASKEVQDSAYTPLHFFYKRYKKEQQNIEQGMSNRRNVKTSTFDIPCSIFCGSFCGSAIFRLDQES